MTFWLFEIDGFSFHLLGANLVLPRLRTVDARSEKCYKSYMSLSDFSPFMHEALREAAKGFEKGEVPVGAVIVDPDGAIVARAHNQPISLRDPCAHAEILALRQAGISSGNYRLEGSTLVVTLEPCLMCIGAAIHARIRRLVFGALDPKWGAAGSLYNVTEDPRLNHRLEVIPGVLAEECLQLMQTFFQMRRVKA